MKRVVIVLIVIFSFCGTLFAQTEWQGRVARGGAQDFPSEGYYAASNSFARNSIVTVTNPATGKSVRVVISRGLNDNSLFMTLSADAARSLGLDGSFPATMKAQPVIIPGISDQSIGSELPFTRDPDINPSASAGDPNAFVFNSQSVPQDIHPQTTTGQPASTDITDNQANPATLTPASTTKVNPVDVDLSGSSVINSGQDKLPTDVVNQTARAAGSEPPTLPSTGATGPVTTLQNADIAQVPASTEPETVVSSPLSGQPAALSDASPATARSAQPTSNQNLGAATPTAPVQQATINPASTQTVTGVPANNLNATTSDLNGTSDSAIARGAASSLRNLREGQAETSAPNSTETAAPAPSRGGALAAGVDKIGQQKLGQNKASRNGRPLTVVIPPANGVGTGIKSLGDGNRVRPNIGDIERPDHIFAPLNSQSGATNSDIVLPVARDSSTVASAGPGAKEKSSLLDKQLAAISERNLHRQLFGAPHQDADSALLPSAVPGATDFANPNLPTAKIQNSGKSDPSLAGQSGTTGKTPDSRLPLANSADEGKADPSLPGLTGQTSLAANGQLPLANTIAGGNAEASINGLRSGIAAGIPGKLPAANPKGEQRPEASNPYLEGETPLAGFDTTLPVAQLVPGEIPQSSLTGAGPGVALVPDKSDLPMVVLDLTQKVQPGFSALKPNQQSIAAAQLPTPATAGATLPEDPVTALRPAQTIVSLEPSEYRPPQIPAPATDRILANPPQATLSDGKLVEARVKSGLGPDSSLAGQTAANSDLGNPTLATAGAPPGINSDAMLQAMRPQENLGAVSLATPGDRTMPDLLVPGSAPAAGTSNEGTLTEAKTPNGLTKEPSLAGVKGPASLDTNALTVVNPRSPNAENLLPGQKLAARTDEGTLNVNPATPGLPQKGNLTGNQSTTQPTNIVKTPTVTETGPAAGDDQWAQKNLPMVKNLQKEKYYLQVGAFANPRSAKTAIGDISSKYQIAVLPEKAASKSVYKVFIGPLNEDEKGLLLYMFRAKGYRDAFIKKGQL